MGFAYSCATPPFPLLRGSFFHRLHQVRPVSDNASGEVVEVCESVKILELADGAGTADAALAVDDDVDCSGNAMGGISDGSQWQEQTSEVIDGIFSGLADVNDHVGPSGVAPLNKLRWTQFPHRPFRCSTAEGRVVDEVRLGG